MKTRSKGKKQSANTLYVLVPVILLALGLAIASRDVLLPARTTVTAPARPTLAPPASSPTALPAYFEISIAPGVRYKENGQMYYKDNHYGFLLRFPSHLVLDDSSGANWASFLDLQNGVYTQRMMVRVDEFKGTLDEFERKEDNSQFGTKETTIIDGHPAQLFVEDEVSINKCNYEVPIRGRRINTAVIQGDGYMLTLTANDSCETYKTDWFSSVPQSVKFFK